MKFELTDSKKRWLLIVFAISGWITAIFLIVYLFSLNKENEIQPFEEGLRFFADKLSDEIYKKIGNKTVAF
ncbi:hypothetical protein [Candidatus Electronema sp. JM]|uniref:hypothetical protein n=1 Tax=Candidatus Electronema sp. JM TaxID=3401571 RepID=UPI003AA86559